ncbi:MAG: diguanylate cyclase, partial [Lachnospiraceae bacterium]|nr:diguanylate cyclase [Lachnospiraceae bacterium]
RCYDSAVNEPGYNINLEETGMLYDVEYEITAQIFVLFIFVYSCIDYPMRNRKNMLFRIMSIILIVTQSFDILSAYVISYNDIFSRISNILVNTAYFFFGTILCYLLGAYIDYHIIPENGKKILVKTKLILLIIEEIAIIANIFWGFFFYITEDNIYTHGDWFYVMHVVSILFIVMAGISMIINKRVLGKAQILYGTIIISLYVLPIIFQVLFFKNVLIIMFGASLIMLVTFFSLETPDYVKLQTTLEELEATRSELEKLNKKNYDLAHFDQMSELLNRTAYEETILDLKTNMKEIREEKNIIIFMADLNFLKYLNDNQGHNIGDEAIKNVALIIKETFSDKEKCYRIGGDEFCVISIGNDQIEFEAMYQEFLDKVAEKSKQVDYPFSVASAYYIVKDESIDDALQIVDNMMYENKKEIKKQYPHFARA